VFLRVIRYSKDYFPGDSRQVILLRDNENYPEIRSQGLEKNRILNDLPGIMFISPAFRCYQKVFAGFVYDPKIRRVAYLRISFRDIPNRALVGVRNLIYYTPSYGILCLIKFGIARNGCA